ncbi:MAG: hypothetical protein R3349_08510 [Geminicoccaceae bacterium]|nr:hypothetical protein [Geminicoccaceae bacterium]
MLHRIRSSIDHIKGSVAAVAGMASVLAAIVSVHLQIDANADEARIDRSFTLYDHFIGSDSVNYLMTLSGLIEFELSQRLSETTPVDDIKKLSAEVNAQNTGPELYDHMTELLRQSSAIARCAGYDQDERDGPMATRMCDQETIGRLLGESLVDLFFRLRPVMYCDGYIQAFGPYIAQMEAVVGSYMRASGVTVYATVEESLNAPKDQSYVVLEFGPQKHCAPFEGRAQSVALPHAAKAG